MAYIILLRNPLNPQSREISAIEPGTPVIDWLQEYHPHGFGAPVKFYVNGAEKELDDLDYEVGPEDVVVIALMPGDPITITFAVLSLVASAILAAVSYYEMQSMMDDLKNQGKGNSVSPYEISSNQNAARIGEAVPVLYGELIVTPDYVAQPYGFVSWSQANFTELYNGVQYLDLVLCIGQGNIDVSDVFVGETDSTVLPPGVMAWQVFKPAQHQSKMGVISAAMGGGFHESVISSPEVSNQEFIQLNDAAGFFATCPPGHKGSRFQIDITFPGGCFDPDSTGDIRGRQTKFNVYYIELDDNDNKVGSEFVNSITCNTLYSTAVTGPNLNTISTGSTSDKNQTAITSPLRRSYMFTAPRSARWAVRIVRTSGAPNAKNGTDRFTWAGLRLYEDYPAGAAYGDVTLLACRIKASQGLGPDASVRVSVKATRRLPPPGGGSEVQTTSGIDAFADIYRNAVYGANRPETELDLVTLADLKPKWASYKFNHIFRNRGTVWEALRTVCAPYAAQPLPLGAYMSISQDGVKPMRSMMFTDANIVAGSMSINYSFDEEGAADGIEVEYLDPKDLRQMYATYPASALRADKYALTGVTDANWANQYARLVWQRRLGQRKFVTFETELEGLILRIGDRIGIAHNVPKWGDSGLVVGVAGNVLIADHDLDWSGTGLRYVLLRRTDGSVTDPIVVTKGAQDHRMVMATANAVNVDNEYEYTSFAFGPADLMVRDFVVTAVKPNGENTVTVDAANYNPSIFNSTMSTTQ